MELADLASRDALNFERTNLCPAGSLHPNYKLRSVRADGKAFGPAEDRRRRLQNATLWHFRLAARSQSDSLLQLHKGCFL